MAVLHTTLTDKLNEYVGNGYLFKVHSGYFFKTRSRCYLEVPYFESNGSIFTHSRLMETSYVTDFTKIISFTLYEVKCILKVPFELLEFFNPELIQTSLKCKSILRLSQFDMKFHSVFQNIDPYLDKEVKTQLHIHNDYDLMYGGPFSKKGIQFYFDKYKEEKIIIIRTLPNEDEAHPYLEESYPYFFYQKCFPYKNSDNQFPCTEKNVAFFRIIWLRAN